MMGLVKGTVLGAVGYYIVNTVIGELITGTTAADDILTSLVPIVFGLGIAIFVIMRAFAMGGTTRD
jgi:hypothetical protein